MLYLNEIQVGSLSPGKCFKKKLLLHTYVHNVYDLLSSRENAYDLIATVHATRVLRTHHGLFERCLDLHSNMHKHGPKS
jgi:hypothetical protein